MKEIKVEFLRQEVMRLRAVVPQTKVLHPCGTRLHLAGEPITADHVKRMSDLCFRSVILLDPGESESVAAASLRTERVETSALRLGDVLAEAAPGTAHRPGTRIDEAVREALAAAGVQAIAVQRRGTAEDRAKADSYAEHKAPVAARPPHSDTRLERATTLRAAGVIPYFVPQARVTICTRDEFLRAMLEAALVGAGHEVAVQPGLEGVAAAVRNLRAEVLLLDLPAPPDGALNLCRELRKSPEFQRLAILVCVEPARHAEVQKALAAGANDGLEKPIGKLVLLSRVVRSVEMWGRRSGLGPKVQIDRRKTPRAPGNFGVTMGESIATRPLPFSRATILDASEKGARVEYNLPDWPVRHAYTPGQVHPLHPLHAWSMKNPMARQIVVTFPPQEGGPLQVFARFVHVSVAGGYEVAGLAFENLRGGVEERLTTALRRRG